MTPAFGQNRPALSVNLTKLTTVVRLGPFAYGGLKALIGMDLTDVLASLMIAGKTQRRSSTASWTCSHSLSPTAKGSPSPSSS